MNERTMCRVGHERMRPELGISLWMIDCTAWIVASRVAKVNECCNFEVGKYLRFEPKHVRVRSIIHPRAWVHILSPYLVHYSMSISKAS